MVPTQKDLELFKRYLQSFNIFNESEVNSLLQICCSKLYNKNEYFIEEGKVCNEVSFLVQGCLRSYFTNAMQEEITYCFTFPQTFITAYSSFITQEPTEENIVALSEVRLLSISKEKLDALSYQNLNWLTFFKKQAEQQYIALEKRIFALQKLSAKSRYQQLLVNHPNYIQNIQLKYLASYLGITPRHFSRIRSQVKGG